MKGDISRPAIVYIVTNKVNGKRYIGVTSGPLRRRIREHFCHAQKQRNNGAFYRAIRKYGKDCFEWSVLVECENCTLALSEEIRLIKEMEPEYNSTLGGDGRLGGYLTDEGRLAISLFHKGKQWGLGRTLSEESKSLIREKNLTPEAKERWSKSSHLGPKSMAKKVQCIDDGALFESASAAARVYGVSRSALIELCLGKNYRKSVGGMRFRYVET